jgi:hypothetical protein
MDRTTPGRTRAGLEALPQLLEDQCVFVVEATIPSAMTISEWRRSRAPEPRRRRAPVALFRQRR